MVLSYKRHISIFLIIIILFNFAWSIKVKAEPITLTTAGLIVFAMAITALGITIFNSDDFKILFNDFLEYLRDLAIDINVFLNLSFNVLVNLIKTGLFELGDILETIIDYILTRFKIGENTLTLGEGLVFDKEYNINVYDNGITQSIYYTGPGIYRININIIDEFENVDGEVTLILNIKENRVFSWIDYKVYYLPAIDLYEEAELYFNGNLMDILDWDVFRFNDYYYVARVMYMDHGDEYFREVYKISFDIYLGRLRIYTEGLASSYGETYDFKESLGYFIYDDYSWMPSIPIPEPYAIPYRGYGGVLESEDDYPSFPFPATVPIPSETYPGVYVNEDGNILYPGTPEGFVAGMDTKYVDDWLKNIAGREGISSIPGVIPEVREGVIEFPRTIEDNPPWDIPVESPWDIPIDVPSDVPVPDVPTGLGVISWLLKYIAQGVTGIWNFLSKLFSSPTKSLNFDSLLNLNVKDKFPFCLPWDLYNAVATISAEPKIPEFKVNIKGAIIDINFIQFEELAKITRWATTLIYTISLIMISRRLIGGE